MAGIGVDSNPDSAVEMEDGSVKIPWKAVKMPGIEVDNNPDSAVEAGMDSGKQ